MNLGFHKAKAAYRLSGSEKIDEAVYCFSDNETCIGKYKKKRNWAYHKSENKYKPEKEIIALTAYLALKT